MYEFPSFANILFLAVLALWTVVWKVYAVWMAVKHNHKKWFVAMVILNTLGILEIIYIFYVIKKSWAEVKRDFGHALSSGVK